MTKNKAHRKLQRAEDAYYNHIYTERGTVRAVLSFEKAYFERRRLELKAKVTTARSLFNSL